MNKATSKWRAADCTEKKPSVCELPISRAWDYGKCDPSLMWEWHPEVNKCYYNVILSFLKLKSEVESIRRYKVETVTYIGRQGGRVGELPMKWFPSCLAGSMRW